MQVMRKSLHASSGTSSELILGAKLKDVKCPEAQVLDFLRDCAGRLCVLVQPCTDTCSHQLTHLYLVVYSSKRAL